MGHLLIGFGCGVALGIGTLATGGTALAAFGAYAAGGTVGTLAGPLAGAAARAAAPRVRPLLGFTTTT